MKTITSLLLGALSSALQVLGFHHVASCLDPLNRIAAANHSHLSGTAAFTGLPTELA